MKKLLLFAFAVITLDAMGPCGGSHHHDYPDPYLNVSPGHVVLGNQQDASSIIEVKSNSHWSVYAEDAKWLKVDPSSGNGDAVIRVAALSNETAYERSCILIISNEEFNRQVRVTQKGKTPVVDQENGL